LFGGPSSWHETHIGTDSYEENIEMKTWVRIELRQLVGITFPEAPY